MRPEEFRKLADPLPEPTLLVDDRGTITAANLEAEELLGFRRGRLAGVGLTQLVADSAEKVRAYLDSCSRSRSLVIGALTLRVQGREPFSCRASGAVVEPWTDDAPALLLLRFQPRQSTASRFLLLNQKIEELAREVRERKRAEAERTELLEREQAARAEAEEANRLKDEFLATVSHELRTPLNAILGWARILRSPELDPETRERAIETVERNARNQAQLIDDLLDVSRIISGKIRLDVQPLYLADAVRQACDAVQPAADAKEIRFEKLLDPRAGPVSGDADRLQQVVWNLLSNAVKFTPKGGRVQVRLERVDSRVEIIISDTGKGIGPEVLPHIFERFRQADSSTSRTHSGLGLGLAIVRHLVELHGGQVVAESAGLDQGATFTVSLPVALFQRPETFDGSAPERAHPTRDRSVGFRPDSRLAGLRILIVEDEPDSRDLLVALLERCGAEVAATGSAAEAFDALKQRSLDCIVSDIEMPGEDGYTFIRRVREAERESGRRVPAVALTAYARTQDRMRALAAGFQMHVPKPVEPAELLTVVASLCGRAGTEPAAPEP